MFNITITTSIIAAAAAISASAFIFACAGTASAATYRSTIYDPTTGTYTHEDAPDYTAPAPASSRTTYYDSYTGTYYYYDQWGNRITYTRPVYDPYYNVVPVNTVYSPIYTYTAPVQPVVTVNTAKRTVRTPYGTVTVTSSAKDDFNSESFTVITTETIGRTEVTFYGDEYGYTAAVWKSGRNYYTAKMSSTDFFSIESAVAGII
ncbi:MAG: hypothetical protein ILP19_06785 [Oscillospiraceae bacterium]|nr:hypothetical protein [Oscillospiraceae bacterium]